MPAPTPFLPLTPRTFHILLALAETPRNGYQVMGAVEDSSRGRVPLGPGTLYAALHRLAQRALIEEIEAPTTSDADGRGQRFYRLTALGERVARAEAQRLEADVRLARALRILEAGS